MNIKHSIKTLVVIGFLLISTMGLLVPSVSAYPMIDEDDGIWTDDFNYDNQTEVGKNLSYTNINHSSSYQDSLFSLQVYMFSLKIYLIQFLNFQG